MTHTRPSFLFLAASAFLSSFARAQQYERIDVNNQGSLADGVSLPRGMSDDGRYVLFLSTASNLGGTDVQGAYDVFVRDRTTGTTEHLPLGLPGPNSAFLSGDGNRVFFVLGSRGSSPTTLHSYMYDRAIGSLTEIQVAGQVDVLVVASDPTGRFLAVTARPSSTSDLRAFRVDILTGGAVLCSRTDSGTPVSGRAADIDDDGTHVLFTSESGALTPGDLNNAYDAFVLDIPGNVLLRASVSSDGSFPSAPSTGSSISGDGRMVCLVSVSPLTPEDMSNVNDVYIRDLRLQTTTLATTGQGHASFPRISKDGTAVAFNALIPVHSGEPSTNTNVFLRDFTTSVLHAVSTGSTQILQSADLAALSRDGRRVLIFSGQPGMPQPSTSGGIYVADFGPRCSASGFCTSLTNSTGAAAIISTQGDASRALNNLVIAGLDLPNGAIAMLVSGVSAIDPGVPFGNGLLCVGGTLMRHGIHVASGGVILDFQDVNSPEYAAVNPGDTRNYQIFYRDPPAGGANFNTTDAVAVTFCW